MGLLLQPRYYSDLSHPSQPPSLGTLLFFMLENVPGILTPVEKNSSVRFVDEVLGELEAGSLISAWASRS